VSVAASGGWLAALALVVAWLLLQRGVAAHSEAVTRACHELRGPLAAARLGVELGTRGRPLSAAQLRAIGSELGRATLALDDLARIRERQQREGESGLVDLRALLADSVEAWRATAAAAGVELRWAEPVAAVLVRGQRLRLAQAAGNLIANAIEHGGGRVEVAVSVSGGVAQVGVCDDGPGLPDSVASLAGQARRGRGTRGRGLAIVSGIAAVHGGRLRAVSAPRGAHLVMELPVLTG
jgi:signal transduction histidine kinase